MSAAVRSLMADLANRGVKLWVDGEILRVRAPEHVLTAELQRALAARKPEIISFLLANVAAPAASEPDEGALSAGQRSIWFQHQLLADKALYNIYADLRLCGVIDVDVLQRSFDHLVARHEALRTRFCEVDGVPRRIVDAPFSLPLTTHDLRAAADPDAAFERLRRAEIHTPFDLATGPLTRVVVARVGERESRLLLVQHHVMIDGWSMALFLSELIERYRQIARGEPIPSRPAPLSMSASLALTRLSAPLHARHVAYWKERLRDLPPLRLPTDLPPPAVPGSAGATLRFSIDAGLTARIKALGAGAECTLFVTLLAAWALLLHRMSGQRAFPVGTVVANRGRAELHDVIGCFINTLLLRCEVGEGVTFRQLLAQLRATVLEAFEHQALPFDEVVRAARAGNEALAASPIQACFLLENIAMPTVRLDDVACETVLRTLDGSLEDTAKFDVMLAIAPTGERLEGALQYRTELYGEAGARRMVGHFCRILESVVADPDTDVARVAWLTAAERDELLAWSTGDTAPLPDDDGVCARFSAMAARMPEAIAATAEGAQLSYGELHRRSNAVAARLVARGVAPDAVVPLFAPRGLDFLTAIVGILKAGGAWLPVDTRQPAPRVAEILRQAKAPFWLVADSLLPIAARAVALLPAEARPACLPLSALCAAGGVEDDLPPRAGSQHLAYVLFTSGSTGTPKGAMVEHAGLFNHLLVMNDLLSLAPGDTVAQTAHQCFDVSVWQMLSPLLAGATVAVISDDDVRDPRRLLATFAAERVTIAQLVPAQVYALLDDIDARPGARQELTTLRRLSVSGEALPPDLARRWLARFAAVPLLNAYGPAECSDDVSLRVITEPPPPSVAHMPIGRPIRNVRLYVVDAHLQLQPVGVPGELCVAGIGVGRGYLHDEARTRAQFVPDPFVAGGRMYRTGDLARWLPTGELEYLGRTDHQVKVRGIRIEPGEIEAAAETLHGVAQCVVTVVKKPGHEARLCAFVVPRGAPPSTSAVRAHLAARLPEAMVPSQVVFVDALPLSPNGKVDRAALVVPELDVGATSARTPPRTPREAQLVALWERLLDVRPIGVDDDFFALGGHSLLAVKLVAELERLTGRRLAVSSLIGHRTVAALTALLDDTTATAATSLLVPLAAGDGAATPLFLVHPVGGNVLCYATLAARLGVPVWALQSRALAGGAAHASVGEMAAAYVAELMRVRPRGPYRLGGWSMGGLVAYEMAQLLARAGHVVERLVLLDSWALSPWQRQLLSDPEVRRQRFAAELALGGVDEAAGLAALYDVFDANLRALERHELGGHVDGALLVRARRSYAGDDDIARWRACVHQLVVAEVDGDHHAVVTPPAVDEVARLIREYLEGGGP